MTSDTLLPEFDQEMATTRKVLERVPDDAFSWKPHDKSFSMGDLATHVANIPSWVAATVDGDGIDLAEPFEPPKAATRSEILALFDRNVAAGHGKIAGVSDERLRGGWSLRHGEQVFFTLPRSAVLRRFVLSHLIHHRAQLAVYLRLRDVPVPSIYGPSADESVF